MHKESASLKVVAALLGAKVKARRLKLGWSQYRLADEAHVERAQVTRLELGDVGERGVGLAKLVRIANALGVEVGDLFPRRRCTNH